MKINIPVLRKKICGYFQAKSIAYLFLSVALLFTSFAANAFDLMVSDFSDRSSPTLLSGSDIEGNAYIFITPETDISQARFYLDTTDATGSVRQTENNAPYDFGGGSVAVAAPFDTNTLSDGAHFIFVSITLADNSIVTTQANFIVSNNVVTTESSTNPAATYVPPPHDDSVGTLPGSFGVSPSGAATYTIPIEVPPGINGMQPNLAFSYNSQASNGDMGVGWELSGLSAITRCPTKLEIDGFIDGVDYDDNDLFCLDGQRLVLSAGVYGAANSEYQTENDSVVKVVANGHFGNGPLSFNVYHKNGVVSRFGSELDARYFNTAETEIYSWKIKAVEDRFGNQVNYNYSNSSTIGEYKLDNITYSDYKVAINWTVSRDDNFSGYVAANTNYSFNYRLDRVAVEKNNADEMFSYVVSYENLEGVSTVANVVKCQGVSRCISQTDFYMNESSAQFDINLRKYHTGTPFNWSQRHLADVNGDGYIDLITWNATNSGVHVIPGTKNGSFNYAASSYHSQVPFTWKERLVSDINGDGFGDLVTWNATNSGVYVIPGTKSGFNYAARSYHSQAPFTWKERLVADVNGDGFGDLVTWNSESSGVYVIPGTVNNSFDYNKRIYHSELPFTWSNRLVADVNGDGMADLITSSGNNIDGIYILPGTENGGFDYSARKYQDEVPFTYQQLLVADVNGDGFSDLITSQDGYGTYILLGAGDGTFSYENRKYHSEVPFTWAWKKAADVNGDGYADLVTWHSTSYGIYIIPGNGKGDFSYGDRVYYDQTPFNWAWRDIADINGDGQMDFVMYSSSSSGVYVIPGVNANPFAVNKISNRIGRNITINYRPLTDSDIYEKGTSANFPEFDYQGSLNVVTSVQTDNGIGGTNTTNYAYEGMKAHRKGLGFLGFRQIDITNEQTGTTSSATYSQNWQNRTVGMMEEEIIRASDGTVLSQTVNELANRYEGIYSNIYFPYTSRSTRVSRDLNGALISTLTQESTLNNEGKLTDSYTCTSSADFTVNQLLPNTIPCSTIGTGDRYQHSHFEYWADNLTPDLPGPVKTKTLTVTVPNLPPYQSATEAQTVAYDYHWTQGGVLKSETIEPDFPSLQLKTEHTYYANGLKDTVTVSGYDLQTNVTKFYYNSNGTLDRSTEGFGNQNLTSQWFYTDTRFPWLATATRDPNTPLGYTTQSAYDSFGLVYQSTDKLGVTKAIGRQWCDNTSDCDSSIGEVFIEKMSVTGLPDVSMIYDKFSRQVRFTTFGYNNEIPAPITKTTRYNARGKIEFTSIPYYNSEANLYGNSGVSNDYDVLGRLIKTLDQDGRQNTIAYNGHTTTYTNAKNQTRVEIKNPLNQQAEVRDTNGKTIHYQYDSLGNLVWMQDSIGNEWKIGYNSRGFKTQMLDPDQGYLNYTYDGIGRLRTQTDNKNQVAETTYDNLGRRISQTHDRDGTPIVSSWSYYTSGQHLGKLQSVTGNGFTESYTYDAQSRLWQTTSNISGTNYTSTRAYDNLGRLEYLTYPGSTLQIKHEYEPTTGILHKVSNAANNTLYWDAFHQNASGTVEGYTLGGQINVSTNHNATTGLVDSIFASRGNTSLVAQTYTYNELGNLTDRIDTVNDVHDQYYYDGLNRLTDNNVFRNSSGALIDTQTLSFDELGNIQTKSDVENGSFYLYDGAGCANINQSCTHAVSQIGSQHFVYDANGNMTSGYGRTLQYTPFNKPSSISKNGNTTSFTYGPNHGRYKRVDTTSAGTTSTYYLQGLMEKVTSGATTKTKLYIGDFAVVTQQSGQSDTTHYFLKDHLGSLIAIANTLGGLVENFNYDPWGKRRHVEGDYMSDFDFFNFTSLAITNKGFTGHEYLNEVGLIHMNGRVYDPVVGRFLNADPLVQDPFNLQALNRYSYVLNNPLGFTDPTGFYSLDDLQDDLDSLAQNIGDVLAKFDEELSRMLNVDYFLEQANEFLEELGIGGFCIGNMSCDPNQPSENGNQEIYVGFDLLDLLLINIVSIGGQHLDNKINNEDKPITILFGPTRPGDPRLIIPKSIPELLGITQLKITQFRVDFLERGLSQGSDSTEIHAYQRYLLGLALSGNPLAVGLLIPALITLEIVQFPVFSAKYPTYGVTGYEIPVRGFPGVYAIGVDYFLDSIDDVSLFVQGAFRVPYDQTVRLCQPTRCSNGNIAD